MSKVSTSEIESTNDLEKCFKQSESMLLIIDAHRAWSGRCEILLPSFRALCLQYDNCEERMAFLSMEVPKFTKEFESKLILPHLCNTLSSNINEGTINVADDQEEDGTSSLFAGEKGCVPLFLAIRTRKLVGIVLGADFPNLAKIVREHIPQVSEEDKIEATGK